MEITKVFASNVRRIRRAKEISQEELAHNAGIHRTYLSALERSGDGNPSLRVAQALADALKVPLSHLIERDAQSGTDGRH